MTGEQTRLVQDFETRRKSESRQFAGLDADRIAQYRNEKRESENATHEALYLQWLADGQSALTTATNVTAQHASFRTVVLPPDYNLFGGVRHAS